MRANATAASWLEAESLTRHAASVAIGIAVSVVIFYGLAGLQHQRIERPAADVDDLRSVTLPIQPPPPPTQQEQEVPIPDNGLIQLEASPSPDSEVKIPASPITADTVPLVNAVPRLDFTAMMVSPVLQRQETDLRHIYSRSELDQTVLPIYRQMPEVTQRQLENLKSMRATFMLVVETNGSVSSVHLAVSCGDPDVDQACVTALHEWKFRAPLRKGHAVRCWVQQVLVFKVSGATPFETH